MDTETQMAAEQHRDMLAMNHVVLMDLEWLFRIAKTACEIEEVDLPQSAVDKAMNIAAALGLSNEFKRIIEDN